MDSERPQRTSSGTRARGYVVLVAEPSVDLRILFVLALVQRGYAVLQAADAREALETARTARPDAIVLNLSLPTADGIGIVRHLQENEHTKHAAVIGLVRGEVEPAEAAAPGVVDVLTMPCAPELLADRVGQALARAEAIDDAAGR